MFSAPTSGAGRSISLIVGGIWLCGCAPLTLKEQTELDALQREIATVSEQLMAARQDLAVAEGHQQNARMALNARLDALTAELEALPKALSAPCPVPQPAECEAPPPVAVVNANDKLVVGFLEQVYIEPPGQLTVARIDTGAESSSIHAEDIVEFERDGEDWVRFTLTLEGVTSEIERQVERYVRVYQQADPDGTRRAVVRLRVRMGNFEDSFEFTLADRSHLNNDLLLGRNFLTDVALVDVGREFVQPPPAQD